MNEWDAEERCSLSVLKATVGRRGRGDAASAVRVNQRVQSRIQRSMRARKCRVSSTLDSSLIEGARQRSPTERLCSSRHGFGGPYSMTRGTTYH